MPKRRSPSIHKLSTVTVLSNFRKSLVSEKLWLLIILTLFLILGIVYAVITPVFEASDELWHYPMIRHLADGNKLPVQVFDPELAGPWKQEASQPPLYYYLGAALTFWIDTSDMEKIRWLNPHVDNGVITPDGNINLAIHDPEADPLKGTLLAVRVIRIFSVLLGTLTVYLTYRIAKAAVPGRTEIHLGAAAINAFLPMFIFISGAVNNDNLVITLVSLALLVTINVGIHDYKGWAHYALLITLGALIGLGALTKISALGLLPLALGAVLISRWRVNGRALTKQTLWPILWQSAVRFVLLLVPVILIAGWWYYRNIQLYDDWRGWNAFIAVLGRRQTPASLGQLWDESWGFMISYWGLFGGLNVPMSEWIYRLLNLTAIAASIGFIAYAVLQVRSWYREQEMPRRVSEWLNLLFQLVENYFALVLCTLWIAAVVFGLIQWATITWSSQGRLVFSAISALSTLMIVGLVGLLPKRPAVIVTTLIGSFMFVVAALAPFIWIRPAYQPASQQVEGESIPVAVEFGDVLRMKDFTLGSETVIPGDELDLFISWEVIRGTNRDWSAFVHLVDPVLGQPIAQRDMYFNQGLQPTSLLAAGDIVVNRYLIGVPETAVAPAELELRVGLYDFESGERLLSDSGKDNVLLTQIPLAAAESEFPNPVAFNFEDQLELVGFDIAPRRVTSGEAVQLNLYWRPYKDLEVDYTFFAQVVDEDTTRWASNDLLEATSAWEKDEVRKVELPLLLDASTPARLYPIIIGLYTRPDGFSFDRLQLITAEGRLTDDFLELTHIVVE